MNQAELSEREKRELWAERQLAAARRSWRLAGYVLAILAALFVYWIVWESGFIAGYREGKESAERP